MKFTKTLIAASLLASAGFAQAAQFSTSDEILNVIDTTNQSSYSLDLGVTPGSLESLTPSSSPLTYTTDSNFSAFWNAIGAGDSVVFSVEGQYNAATSGKALPHLDATFTTANASDISSVYANSTAGVTALSNATGGVNIELTQANAGVATGSMSVVYTSAATGYIGAYGTNNSNTEGSLTNAVAVGSSLNLWEVNKSGSGVAETLLSPVSFAVNNGVGTLTIGTTTSSAVPVPASVWMFLSGIAGLVSLKRRKAA
ncbi:MAG: VPLPA-CTERM sorting domain-containing protein [Methylomonas sp.]|jgi:hypothetical protein